MNAEQLNEISNKLRIEKQNEMKKNVELLELLVSQNTILQNKRKELYEVSKLAKELILIEDKRNKIIEQLNECKTEVLNNCSSNIAKDSILSFEPNDSKISKTKTGVSTLKIIERIENRVSKMISTCAKSDSFSVTKNDLNNFIIEINDIIQESVDDGIIKESKEDTFTRQSYVISALAGLQENK